MGYLDLGSGEGLSYRYDAPAEGGACFVFVNALTGDRAQWEAEIAPALRGAGHGTLTYNLRGQADSPWNGSRPLSDREAARDLGRLLEACAPPRPIPVGLSIGGLFALQAHLAGAAAIGLVLINTLRAPGPRLDWINEAVYRAASLGGPDLVKDLYLPFLVGPGLLSAARGAALVEETYRPPEPDSTLLALLGEARGADWNVAYERVAAPVLALTGAWDRVFQVRADLEALLARLPQAREVVLPEAGHLLPMERGAETARLLLDFADGLA